MLEVYLNSKSIKTRDDLHDQLEEVLELPEHYGRNLDALWDILSTESDSLLIYMSDPDILIDNLAGYGESFIELLLDLDDENENIEFYIME